MNFGPTAPPPPPAGRRDVFSVLGSDSRVRAEVVRQFHEPGDEAWSSAVGPQGRRVASAPGYRCAPAHGGPR